MWRRSLRGIALVYVALILFALLGVCEITSHLTRQALTREADLRLALEADEIANAGTIARMIPVIDRERRNRDSADLFFALFDGAGRQVARAPTLRKIPAPGYSDFDERAGLPDVGHGRALTRRLDRGATLVVISDNDAIDRFDALLVRVQLIGLALAMMIVVGGTIGMMWEIGRRLRSMQRTVEAVIGGDFSSRVPGNGSGSEFDRQAAAFNAMLDRIGTLMADVRHAAKDVAHELKSPLARLRNRVAALERRAADSLLAAEITETLAETDELLTLFASLMRLWEIEGGHRRERFAELDLAALTREAVESLTPVAEDAGHHLTLIADPVVPIRGERTLLRQLLVNLIENAIRHTPQGTSIAAHVALEGGRARLVVSDTGTGIPADQHAHVIRRFGRLDRSADAPGQGIGLTLVDAIVRLHDGRLTLEDAEPGLRVMIDLPRSS